VTPTALLAAGIIPAAALLPDIDSRAARVLMLAIAGQESDWTARVQDGGPARGRWQFEIEDVTDVLTRAGARMTAVCEALDVPAVAGTIYEAIAWNDPLAASVARLALWLNPAALPAVGDVDGAWSYYDETWRPGTPRSASWGERYASAVAACGVPT